MNAVVIPSRTGARFCLLVGFWVFVGLFGGTSAWIGERLGGGSIAWTAAVSSALLAALIWVPITVAAVVLAQRFPLRSDRWLQPLVVHGLAALAVSFVLNFGFFAVEFLFIGRPMDFGSWLRAGVSAGFYYLHINALVYFTIVGVTHAYRAFQDRGSVVGRVGVDAAVAETRYASRLTAGTAGRKVLIDVADIRWIEADGDYARVHVAGAEHLVSERMKHLETQLDPARFVRIHRSRIVNVGRVRTLRHVAHGDYEVTLDDDTALRVSRARRKELVQAVERIGNVG